LLYSTILRGCVKPLSKKTFFFLGYVEGPVIRKIAILGGFGLNSGIDSGIGLGDPLDDFGFPTPRGENDG